MKRLTKVELRRLFSRRLTTIAMLGALVVTGVMLFGSFQEAKPLSAPEQAAQQAQFDQAKKDWAINGEQQALLAIVMPLMFLTPVIYPPASAGAVAKIMKYNPLTPFFGLTRYLLYGTGSIPYTGFAIVFGGTLVVATFGWLLFRLVMPLLVERMDA